MERNYFPCSSDEKPVSSPNSAIPPPSPSSHPLLFLKSGMEKGVIMEVETKCEDFDSDSRLNYAVGAKRVRGREGDVFGKG